MKNKNSKKLVFALGATLALTISIVCLANDRGAEERVIRSNSDNIEETIVFNKAKCVTSPSEDKFLNVTTVNSTTGTTFKAKNLSEEDLSSSSGIARLENSNDLRFYLVRNGEEDLYFQQATTITVNFTSESSGTFELKRYYDHNNYSSAYFDVATNSDPLELNYSDYRRFDFVSYAGSLEITSISFEYSCSTTYDDPLDSETSVLSKLEITNPATKLDYRVGDTADYTGLEVTAHFTKTDDAVIPHNQLEFSGFNTATTGKKTVQVSYTYLGVTKSTDFNITVFDGNNVTLDFYTFNDWHGNVIDSNLGVGLTKTTTFLKQQSQGKNAVMMSSGDMWQGSLESNSNRGELMTRWMQSLNFAAMTIGNHEFDWGVDVLRQNSSKYSLPILGINIIDKTTGKRADYVQPSTIIYRGGAKIGIIGAIGDCYSSISYSKVMDVEFVLDEEGGATPLTDLIEAEATSLRSQGCDFIVYSFHGDSYHNDTYYNPEISDYVDVVLEGHKHIETYYQDVKGKWHFQSQAGDNELAINHFTVNLNVSTNAYTLSFDSTKDIYYMNQPDKKALAEDRATRDLIYSYNFAPYYNSIGTNSKYRNGNYLRQLCADLYLQKGIEKWSNLADQIVLGGGYISIRGDGFLPIGNVNYSQFYNLFPFDNDIMLIKLKGSLVKSGFINNDNSNYYLSYTEYGANLRDHQDQIIDDNWYYLVVDTYGYDYLFQYNADKVTDEGHYSTTGFYARDCMAEYAAAGGFYIEGAEGIEHSGAYDDPFTVEEAYKIAQSNPDSPSWGYVKGVVTDTAFTLENNYLTNVELKDSSNESYKMSAKRIHKFDGDYQFGSPVYGFKSTSELPANSEVLMYAGFKEYNGVPGFSSVNMLILADGTLPSGNSVDNPISIVNFWQADLFNDVMDSISELYVYGRITGFTTKENDSTVLDTISLMTPHSVDFASDMLAHYQTTLDIQSGATFTFATGYSINDIQFGADAVIKLSDSGIEFSRIQKIEHPGTLEAPFSVTDALLSALQHNSASDKYYCTGVVVDAGGNIGVSGDINNVRIRDTATGRVITIYYLRRYDGAQSNPSDNFTNQNRVQIGDVLVVYGAPYTYKGTPQLASGTWCHSINGVVQTATPQE